MSDTSTAQSSKAQNRTEYHRERYRNSELLQLRASISYYQKKRNEGKVWIPGPMSKLSIRCMERNVDPKKLIMGEASVEDII